MGCRTRALYTKIKAPSFHINVSNITIGWIFCVCFLLAREYSSLIFIHSKQSRILILIIFCFFFVTIWLYYTDFNFTKGDMALKRFTLFVYRIYIMQWIVSVVFILNFFFIIYITATFFVHQLFICNIYTHPHIQLAGYLSYMF